MIRHRGYLAVLVFASTLLMPRIACLAGNVVNDKQGDGQQEKPKASQGDEDKSKQKPTTRPWQTVKSFSGAARSKQTDLKFLVTTKPWRLTITMEPGGDASDAKNTRIRLALFVEASRDQDDLPTGWKQLDVLYEGDAGGGAGKKIFDDGVGDDGKPKWFKVEVSGHLTKYHVLVEDRREKRGKEE